MKFEIKSKYPELPSPDFFASNEEAMEDIKTRAAL
jgi:hypothetical protein